MQLSPPRLSGGRGGGGRGGGGGGFVFFFFSSSSYFRSQVGKSQDLKKVSFVPPPIFPVHKEDGGKVTKDLFPPLPLRSVEKGIVIRPLSFAHHDDEKKRKEKKGRQEVRPP